jgi:hypothetical protein
MGHGLSNEEKTNDYENFEKEMIYMKILKKGGGSREKGGGGSEIHEKKGGGGGVVEKRGEEETKSMPHAPVHWCPYLL